MTASHLPIHLPSSQDREPTDGQDYVCSFNPQYPASWCYTRPWSSFWGTQRPNPQSRGNNICPIICSSLVFGDQIWEQNWRVFGNVKQYINYARQALRISAFRIHSYNIFEHTFCVKHYVGTGRSTCEVSPTKLTVSFPPALYWASGYGPNQWRCSWWPLSPLANVYTKTPGLLSAIHENQQRYFECPQQRGHGTRHREKG